MYSGFLHGIEIIETTIGPLPVTVVPSAVIGLVGTAPTFSAPTRPPWYTPPAGATLPAWSYGDGANATWPLWNPSAVYAVGDCIVDANGNVQQASAVSSDAESGTSAPSWSTTLNATTADNHVTWKLVQLAPQYQQLNALTLVNGSRAAAGFGKLIRGFTIPYALRAIQLQGAGQVVVVNVYDRNADVISVSAQAHTFPASGVQELSLGHMGVSAVVVKDSTDATTYVLGTDFLLDQVNGTIKQKNGGALSTGDTVHVTYKYATTTDGTHGVANSAVIGAAGPPATGFELLPYGSSQMGFNAKILIAPGFSYDPDVAAQMVAIATKIRAIAIIDAPGGLNPIGGGASAPQVSKTALVQTASVDTTIANRGDLSTAFSIDNQRAVLVYPNIMFTDEGVDPAGATVSNPTDGPYSAWWAGACAANDLARGYWFSPSNIVMLGPLGPDVPFIMSATDPASDSNRLNAAGIVTVFTQFATGLRVWGNRSSAYPVSTDPEQFIAIRRVLDVMEDSLELFSLKFLDPPITNALIMSVLQAVNNFVRLLIQRGALLPGSKVTYDPNNNPPVELAAGHIEFDIDLMPPPPAERIIYNFFVDINLLANVTG